MIEPWKGVATRRAQIFRVVNRRGGCIVCVNSD
ncbi:hypothetical protein Bra1253DRAFT_00105 [Bradyrhizobium sp. WSM1253]|nr:hypothetical protein Bra1253DRAFT_00105 [Bradyrhizobium sp. WSM1253]